MKEALLALVCLLFSSQALACELWEGSKEKYIEAAKKEFQKINEYLDPAIKPSVTCNKHIVTVKFGSEPPAGTLDGNPPSVTIDVSTSKVLSVDRGCC